MKKAIIQIILGLLIFSCSTTKNTDNKNSKNSQEKPITYDFTDKISSEQLNLIKKNYNWNSEKILILNYKQPINSCHFDNNKFTSKNEKWWRNFYSKIDTKNCLNIQVFSNSEIAKNIIDDIHYFDDKNDFLLTTFFDRKKSCFGILVLNDEGYYIQFNGHYSEAQVSKYIENLKK